MLRKLIFIHHRLNEMTRKVQLVQDQLEQSENSHQDTKYLVSFEEIIHSI